MSLQFNDSTSYRGLVQIFEKEISANLGDISGNTTKLKQFTADVNLAYDDFLHLAFEAGGTWQFDDSNQTDYPILTTNIVSGQRDYAFTTDGSSNLILDIQKVLVLPSATATIYQEIKPIDELNDPSSILTADTNGGAPSSYGKLANAIFFNNLPNYNATNGLKVVINREPSYFVYTDTTKKPGVPGNLHRWFALKPAQEYARRFLGRDDYERLTLDVQLFEQRIREAFARRERDVRKRLKPNVESCK